MKRSMGDERRRILIAEDELLIAIDLKAMLDRLQLSSDIPDLSMRR
jgi:hypothetical protein